MKPYWSRRGHIAEGDSHREIATTMGKDEEQMYADGWVRCVLDGGELFLTHSDAGVESAQDEIRINRYSCTHFMVESLRGFKAGHKLAMIDYLETFK